MLSLLMIMSESDIAQLPMRLLGIRLLQIIGE